MTKSFLLSEIPLFWWVLNKHFISFCQLKGKDGSGKPIGRISKQWSGLLKEVFTDTDNFGIQFPLDMDVKMKAVLLGACFLIVSIKLTKHLRIHNLPHWISVLTLRFLFSFSFHRTSCSLKKLETWTSAILSSLKAPDKLLIKKHFFQLSQISLQTLSLFFLLTNEIPTLSGWPGLPFS